MEINSRLIVLVGVTVLVVHYLLKKAGVFNGGVEPALFAKRKLQTDNELEFYGRLVAALPDHYVLSQVAMGALMAVSRQVPRTEASSVRNKFDRKIVDYVIVGLDGSVRFLVELDDKMHDRKKDAERDRMTAAAGYKTFRFESRAKPTVEQLKRAFKSHL